MGLKSGKKGGKPDLERRCEVSDIIKAMKGPGRPPRKGVWLTNITFGILSFVMLGFYGFIAGKLQERIDSRTAAVVQKTEVESPDAHRGQLLIQQAPGQRYLMQLR